MRKTKYDIYAELGIEYDPKTNKVNSPIFGWVKPLLKKGNGKVGESVYTWSTLPGTRYYFAIGPDSAAVLDAAGVDRVCGTCACNCAGCYAETGRYRTDTVIASNMRNTILARREPGWVMRAIIAQIRADRIKSVRIHASGDFCLFPWDAKGDGNGYYADMWVYIADECKNTVFWTYTKIRKYETLFDHLPNANIVKSLVSVDGRTHYNFGKCAEIAAIYDALKRAGENVYLCPCGVPGIGDNVHCDSCERCAKHKYVLFIEHSTGYNPENDPALALIVAILAAQGCEKIAA